MKDNGKLGIALVGLGKYSEGQLAPALRETAHCYLAGIVTGSPEKAKRWQQEYHISEANTYSYENFDDIKDNPEIDIVYVVLPNSMHAAFVERAARAGKHVICEKPMAVSVEECDRMIAACAQAGVMLSIGYRLHFEPHNLEMMRLGSTRAFGEIISLQADHGMDSVDGWRMSRELAGGGPLMDVGIYCVQAARYTLGMEPVAVTARVGETTRPDEFVSIEESISWDMEFPGGVTAHCKCSYTKEMNVLRVEAADGWFSLSPAYAYNGIIGATSEGEMKLPEVNQQAVQMDDFVQAIATGRPSPVPGEMGRQDVKILMAIYEAAASGQRIEISN